MDVSSRTPEGAPNRCPVCGERVVLEPSDPAGDAPCSQCGHLLWFTDVEGSEALMIKLPGESDFAATVIQVGEEVLGKDVPPRLVLDCARIAFFNSPALGEVITLHKKIQKAGGSLKLRNVQPQLRTLIEITRFDRILEVEDT